MDAMINKYLKVLPDQMILKLSVFVFGGGPEAAHHAHVPGLGEGPLVRGRRRRRRGRSRTRDPLLVQHFCMILNDKCDPAQLNHSMCPHRGSAPHPDDGGALCQADCDSLFGSIGIPEETAHR